MEEYRSPHQEGQDRGETPPLCSPPPESLLLRMETATLRNTLWPRGDLGVWAEGLLWPALPTHGGLALSPTYSKLCHLSPNVNISLSLKYNLHVLM